MTPGKARISSVSHSLQQYGWFVGEELRGWVVVIRHFRLLLTTTLVLLALIAAALRPWPPSKVYLATGQAGSSYALLAAQFAPIFARHGVELVLRPTLGLEEGLVRLQDDADPINASFLTGGGKTPEAYASLVSLGSIQFSPLWIFYRGEANAINSIVDLKDLRLGIGLPGSATRDIFVRLASAHGIDFRGRTNFTEASHAAAVELLRSENLDAVFIVDGIDSPNVQMLQQMPGVHMLNLQLAEGYLKRLPEFSLVRIPKGALDLSRMLPKEDVRLLSSTVNLLIQDDMHPALQWLFLLAAREVGQRRNQFFSKPGDFPADLDQTVPLSPIAHRYFDQGLPAVFAYLPLHWAALLDRIWLMALWVFAVGIPTWLGAGSLRQSLARRMLDGLYDDVLWIEQQLDASSAQPPSEEALARLHTVRKLAASMWFPNATDQINLMRNLRALESRFYAVESK